MNQITSLFLGISAGGERQELALKMANRHGLIAGATGTGKTATLQRMAESFARAGVSVFTADIKGDLAGIALAANPEGRVAERVAQLGLRDYTPRGNPVLYWDIYGKRGHPLRTTISELGPILLARLFELNEVQAGVLQIAFSLADDRGLLLLDLKDLRALLGWMSDNAAEIQGHYGNVTKASIGAIQRALLTLEEAGGDQFFGEPALKLDHLLQRDFSGQGVISVLDGTKLIQNPRIYATFLLWLLAELFEQLPEVGDADKPKLVFFFDEAHLLFNNASPALLEKIEQVVRLIRSKGVGIYFVTQNPLDIPETILGQLGNRVQHALRAFTERDQKAVRAAAQTFRPNPAFVTEAVITELGVGEALVSTLNSEGIPGKVERVLVAPPESRLGPISDSERAEFLSRSPVAGVYEARIDRASAHEQLAQAVGGDIQEPAGTGAPALENKTAASTAAPASSGPGQGRQGFAEAFFKSAIRSLGSQVGRQIVRGVLGAVVGGALASKRKRGGGGSWL